MASVASDIFNFIISLYFTVSKDYNLFILLTGLGVGCFIGIQASSVTKSKNRRSTIIIIVSIVICSLVSMLIVLDDFKLSKEGGFYLDLPFKGKTLINEDIFYGNENPCNKFLEEERRELAKSSFMNNIPKNKIKEKLATYTRNGLKRLSFEDLKRLNELKIKMANNSTKVCIGLWKGPLLDSDLFLSIRKLDEYHQEEFCKISYKAIFKEMFGSEFKEPQKNAVANGFIYISKLFDEFGSIKFNRILKEGNNTSDKDACWMTLTYMNAIQSMPETMQENFLRGLAQTTHR